MFRCLKHRKWRQFRVLEGLEPENCNSFALFMVSALKMTTVSCLWRLRTWKVRQFRIFNGFNTEFDDRFVFFEGLEPENCDSFTFLMVLRFLHPGKCWRLHVFDGFQDPPGRIVIFLYFSGHDTGQARREPPRPADGKAICAKNEHFVWEWCKFLKTWFRHPA